MPEIALAKSQRKATPASASQPAPTSGPKSAYGHAAGLPLFLQHQCLSCSTAGAVEIDRDGDNDRLQKQEPGDAGGSAPSGQTAHAAARRGVEGASEPLPHRDRIQASFGSHDVGGARARIGGSAEEANRQLGSAAYTAGNHVGFRSDPDVRLSAHEAAHVVQQRNGVQLDGGVGRPGDKYEEQADAVAERVAANQSAEDLLEQPPGDARGAVQAKCDCGGTCSTCAAGPHPEDENAVVQMALAVSATRVFEPGAGGVADGAPGAGASARGGAAGGEGDDVETATAEGEAELETEAGGEPGETGAEGVPPPTGGGAGSPPPSSADSGPGRTPPGAPVSSPSGGRAAGAGATGPDAGSATGPGGGGGTAGPGPTTAGGEAAAGPSGGGIVPSSAAPGSCTGGGTARCYEEPSEEPAEEPDEAPPNPEATRVEEETSDAGEEDLPEVDDCPPEPGAQLAQLGVSSSDSGGPAAPGAPSAAAAPAGAAGAGESAAPGRGPSGGASTSGGGGGTVAGSAGTPLDPVIASAEAQRGEAVSAYGASSAALLRVVGGTQVLRRGVQFTGRPSESSAAAIRRSDAKSRADRFFAGVADQLDDALAIASVQVPDQLGVAAESGKGLIAAALETEKGAISARIEGAREQARGDAGLARQAVMQQAEAFVVDAEAETTAAIDTLTTTHTETTGQVNDLETTTLDQINEIYATGRTELEDLGTTVGAECTATGAEFASTYRGFRHCTENGFWDGNLSERRSEAQENAARSAASGYHDRIVEAARKRAREVARDGRKSDRCSVIASAGQARDSLDEQLSDLVSALETTRDAAIQQAGTTREGLLSSIDSSLASTLRQLDQQEQAQRQAANDTAYLHQVLQEQIAHAAAAAVQRGVETAASSALSALSVVQAQFASSDPPDLVQLDRALLRVEQNVGGALIGLRASAEGGVAAAEGQLVGALDQALSALGGVTRSNDELTATLSGRFTSSMSAIAGTDNFAAQRASFTAQIQQSTSAGSAALSQALGTMRQGCDATMEAAAQALAQARTDLEANLRQSKQGIECEITTQADKAASEEAPAWKRLVAVLLIIVVIVIVIAVTIATAGGALAALGPIATIAAGAAIGAVVGAVTSGLIAVASNLWNNRDWTQGVGHAILVGAITGAIGGAVGAAAGLGVGLAVRGASAAVQTAAQLGAALVTAGGLDVVTQYVMGGFSFDNFSWTNLGITLVVTVLTFGIAHRVSSRTAGVPATDAPDTVPTADLPEGVPTTPTDTPEPVPTTPTDTPEPVPAPTDAPEPVPAADAPEPVPAPTDAPEPAAAKPWERGRNPARYRRYVRNLQRRIRSGKTSDREPLGPEEWWSEHGSAPVRNPHGGEGTPAHREVARNLQATAETAYPPPRYQVRSNQRVPGLSRKPDAAVIDTHTGRVVKVYEAARFNRSGRLVRPDESAKIVDYENAGIPYEFHPVGPNEPPGGVLRWSPTDTPSGTTPPATE